MRITALALAAVPLLLGSSLSPAVAAQPSAVSPPLNFAALPPGRAIVACASPACRAVADQLVAALQRAHWQVQRVDHGGLGVDGVKTLRVEGCKELVLRVAPIIERAFPSKVSAKGLVTSGTSFEVIDDGSCHPGMPVTIVVGVP
jgi:hypothetical protein